MAIKKAKVLLIGWDAADWKIIDPLMNAGKMPNLQRLIQRGARGQIATLHPPLSPMLWTSIATGKRPFHHGILGFSEPTADGRGVQPVSNLSRKSKALWNILHQNQLRSIVIGWWPSHPAEPIHGAMVSDQFHRAAHPLNEGWPLLANAVHPPELSATIAALRVHPDVLRPEVVEPFIPLASEIDQDADHRLGLFLRMLAECMSIHAATSWLIDHQPWDFFAVYYDAIDHFCHGFMKYHPPRQFWIGERDFELYRNVVSMAYQHHDTMLGTLLEKAGPEVTVILMSDHGFHPDHLRPSSIPDVPAGPAIEHRDFGILAMRGPGIRKGGLFDGASLLDIAPTILALYGLPVGEDMDGKVLSQAFVKAPKIAFIPSWEKVPGADGSHPPHTRLDPVAAHEALEQLVALGYIEPLPKDREVAVQRTIRELQYNLGEAYQDADRHFEAHRILSKLYAEDPGEQRFALRLFASCQALGFHDEMRHIVDDLSCRKSPASDYLKAQMWIAQKRYPEALEAIEQATATHPLDPGLLIQTAHLYLRMRRLRQARLAYEEALAIDPDNIHAHLGLARVALRRGQFSAAAGSALDAVQRVHQSPSAHYLLGLALSGMREFPRAADAFRAAISFNPNFPEAHRRLAALLDQHLRDQASARQHRRLARQMRRGIIHRSPTGPAAPAALKTSNSPLSSSAAEIAPLHESLVVVTGLPRSGTSVLMQMLAAGGMTVLSDGMREPDQDNPRGYLEYEPVKNLFDDSKWLLAERGKAIKIVAPLLAALPPGLPCRVILSHRNIGEVLDSQERMRIRRQRPSANTGEHRRMLRDEYLRTLDRVRQMLASRPRTQVLVVEYGKLTASPMRAARKLNRFLGGGFDIAKMAAAVDVTLHRNRAGAAGF